MSFWLLKTIASRGMGNKEKHKTKVKTMSYAMYIDVSSYCSHQHDEKHRFTRVCCFNFSFVAYERYLFLHYLLIFFSLLALFFCKFLLAATNIIYCF